MEKPESVRVSKDGFRGRQGDVEIILVKCLPEGCKPLPGRKELAFGEATGHAHRLDRGSLFEAKNGDLYLEVDQPATLTHEEHKPKTIKPGVYRVNIKRQYTPGGWNRVTD